jgi:hypothetical protein
LPNQEAAVQFHHIRNHDGSNGPGHAFVMRRAKIVLPSIQVLEM